MKKILLALTVLSAGAGAFHIGRLTTGHLQEEAAILHQAWMDETQRMVAAQAEGAGLTERVGELTRTLAVTKPARENRLWSALQTNRADRFPEPLQARVREEFSFTWQSFKDYIVVSKPTVSGLHLPLLDLAGRWNDTAAAPLAITPEERVQLESAVEKVRTEFKDWVLAQVKREEPGDDLVAHYSLPGDPPMEVNIRTNFYAAVAQAVGQERTDLIRETADKWMNEMGVSKHSTRLTIRREMAGDEARLKVEMRQDGRNQSTYLPLRSLEFPKALRVLFPNGWADLAKREGFELPPPRKK